MTSVTAHANNTIPPPGKTPHRPPALVLDEYNQVFPVQPDTTGGSAVKSRQGNRVLHRLHNLLPASFTSNLTPGHPQSDAQPANEPPNKPELRKQKQPRSASLPSVRWDKSPLKRNSNQGKGLTNAATVETIPLSAEPSTAAMSGHYNVKGLKVRMLTWNMHDSLPKGELEELFGKVPHYAPNEHLPGTFPALPNKADHPYHFVVVAGQECPSLSGLPMALGAGFKLLDKDREREKDKEKEKDKDRGVSPDKDPERSSTPQSRHKDGGKSPSRSDIFIAKPTVTRKNAIPNTDEPPRSPSPEGLQINIPQGPLAGWSSVVEDWLCNGGIFELPKGPKTPNIVEVVNNVVTGAAPGTPRLALKRAPSIKEPRKGPYQLLVKERLMGIYLAVYVHRDLKPLIKGISKSAVTAGLIGGRVGNKGGVGISVNVDGTTLLFLNAHLAAHEGRINHRLANLAKIKAELEVDDFLPPDDPRKSLEDLTDRFDFTFLCGDLNFRLDITRLHADWLISRREYTQALAFDQLLKIMKDGAKEFKGFKEDAINFPPTFKYDVLRTLKRQKRADDEDDFDADADADAASISSVSTTYTRATDVDVNSAQGSPPAHALADSTTKLSFQHVVSAQKAKIRLLALKSPLPLGLPSPAKSGKKTFGTAETERFATPMVLASPSSTVDHFPPTPKAPPLPTAMPFVPPGNADTASLLPPPKIRVESMKSGAGSASLENLEAGKGVYDTSNKKRVPSWCDRILWKTTVEPRLPPSPASELRPLALLSPPPPKSTRGFRALFRNRSAKAASKRSQPSSSTQSDSSSPPYLPPLKTAPPLSQAIFQARLSEERAKSGSGSHDGKSLLPLGASSASALQGRFQRRVASAATSPPLDRSNRRSGIGVLISPLSTGEPGATSGSRWRFLSFLSPNSSHVAEETLEEQVPTVPTPFILHQRGDVICLDYNTLDDRQMRRLEGRSDHRPVLGTFVMYI